MQHLIDTETTVDVSPLEAPTSRVRHLKGTPPSPPSASRSSSYLKALNGKASGEAETKAHTENGLTTKDGYAGNWSAGGGGVSSQVKEYETHYKIQHGASSFEKGIEFDERKAEREGKWYIKFARVLQGPWIRIAIFSAACFFTTALYYGWQQFQMMLFHDGAYSWYCPPGSNSPGSRFAKSAEGDCNKQVNMVTNLYSIAAGCEYASAAFGGAMLDHIGPRRTAMIGEVMWGIGTLLLAFSSQSAPLYIPAMIIIGTSVNVTAFPSLCIVEAYPNWHGVVVGIMLAMENAATGIPPILYALMRRGYRFRQIWLIYLAAVWLPVSVLYIIALPNGRDFEKMLEVQKRDVLDIEAKMRQRALQNGRADPTATQGLLCVPGMSQTTAETDVTRRARTALERSDSDDRLTTADDSDNDGDYEEDGETADGVPISDRLAVSEVVNRTHSLKEHSVKEQSVKKKGVEGKPEARASWREFGRNAMTVDMLVMVVYFFSMSLMYAYYPTIVRQAISPQISDYVAYAMPTQAVWALGVGVMCDFLSTPTVMAGMCVALATVFALCLAPNVLSLQYIAATLLIVTQPALFEVKFSWVEKLFDPYNYGKLVGMLGVAGGIGTFVNIPASNHRNYRLMFVVYLCLLPLTLIQALYLSYRQHKLGIHYRTAALDSPSRGPQQLTGPQQSPGLLPLFPAEVETRQEGTGSGSSGKPPPFQV